MSRCSAALIILNSCLFILAESASACETLALVQHTVDPVSQEADTNPPGKVEFELIEVAPGNGYLFPSGEEMGCMADAHAGFRIRVASDDQTPFEQLGFRFVLTDGALPAERMYFPTEPVLAHKGYLYVMWRVDMKGPIEAVDFTVALVAVDAAGNEGPVSDPVRIQHPQVHQRAFL